MVSPAGSATPAMIRYLKDRSCSVWLACSCANAEKVVGEAQGDGEAVKKLLKDLNNGPSAAHVVKVEKEVLDVKEGEKSFSVR